MTIEKEKIDKKLDEIYKSIVENLENETEIGLLSGKSGICLFLFYYSEYLGSEEPANLAVDILTETIERINTRVYAKTYCSGLSGIGWLLNHLAEEGFIDVDIDSLSSSIDEIIEKSVEEEMEANNYDFLHGVVGYGWYYLKRYNNVKFVESKDFYKKKLFMIVDYLRDTAEEDINGFKWSTQRLEKHLSYDLSLAHGISSIIVFLSKLYALNEFKVKSEKLLFGSIQYLLTKKNLMAKVHFPDHVLKEKKSEEPIFNSRISWCYGDLGIGNSLLLASRFIGNRNLESIALETLKNVAKRSTKEYSFLNKDAILCHGTFGNALIFLKLSKIYSDSVFSKAATFWINDGLEKGTRKSGYAGYSQYTNIGEKVEWINKLSILEGISGIGLCLINYGSKLESCWDECLMLR